MDYSEQNLTPEERAARWEKEVQHLHRVYAQSARKLADQRVQGKRRSQVQRDFFRSPKVKRAAVLKSIRGAISRDTCNELAAGVNLFDEQQFRVGLYALQKRGGGSRTICALPPALKASHKMIKAALDAELDRHMTLFGVRNAGREEAAQHIQTLQRNGFNCIWQADIKECFDSFNLDALYQLPLNERIISNVLDTRKPHFFTQAFPDDRTAKEWILSDIPGAEIPTTCENHDQGNTGHTIVDTHDNTRGPLGLMQGSPASSAILAWHLNEFLNGLAPMDNTRVIVCFDNLLIASRTDADGREIRNTLAGCLDQCSFGPLELHKYSELDPETGIDFLGYNHAPNGSQIGLGHLAKERLMQRLNEIEQRFEESGFEGPVETTFEIWRALLNFCDGYSSATDIAQEVEEFIQGSLWVAELARDPAIENTHLNLFRDKTVAEQIIVDAVRRM